MLKYLYKNQNPTHFAPQLKIMGVNWILILITLNYKYQNW